MKLLQTPSSLRQTVDIFFRGVSECVCARARARTLRPPWTLARGRLLYLWKFPGKDIENAVYLSRGFYILTPK